MNRSDLDGILQFLRSTERLKDVCRTSFTSTGRRESVAEHSWRLCLMALVLEESFPRVDFARLIELCIIHDLGEAIGGDIPAPEQDRPGAGSGKRGQERRDLIELLTPLPVRHRRRILEAWDEYERAETPEARLAKALDKLETILQHNQGKNPPDFDYLFNLEYGREYTDIGPLILAIREILDRETSRRAERRPG